MATKNILLPVASTVSQQRGYTSQPAGKAAMKDFFKMLNQSQKQVTSVETQRISRVLHECIQKVKTVSQLPILLEDLEGMSAELKGELLEALRQYMCLEKMLTAHQLEHLDLAENKEAQLGRLEKKVQNSLRDILHQLSGNPAATHMLQSLTTSVTSQLLIQGLEDLHHLLLEKLFTNSAEQKGSESMQDNTLRHVENMELVRTLEAEVAAAVQDLEVKVSKNNEVIWTLKSSLHEMSKLSADFVIRVEKDAKKQSQSDRKTSEGRCVHLQQEISQLHAQLSFLIIKNREKETDLRKGIYKVENGIENWIEKYDSDMGAKQTQIEALSMQYAEEEEELRELDENYTLMEVEFLQIMEERRIARQQQEEEKQALAIKGHAALVIQAYWRGYKVRKTMKVKSKGKKTKKGKGKKGK